VIGQVDLTIPEVALELRCSLKSVYRLLKNGTLRGYKVGHNWRIRAHAIERVKQPIDPPAPPAPSRRRRVAHSITQLPGWDRYTAARRTP
jgi:excisionase family DNA binding protein